MTLLHSLKTSPPVVDLHVSPFGLLEVYLYRTGTGSFTTVSVACAGIFKFTLLENEIGLMPAFPTPIKDFGSNDFAKQCYVTAHPFF